MTSENEIKRSKVILKDISCKAWEHPADRAALNALRAIPGFDILLRKLFGNTTERALRLGALASSVRVTPLQFRKIHLLFDEACQILNPDYTPELYIANDPFINAGAVGVDEPFIMLNSSLISGFDDKEILAVIAHELGHCMSGHALYKTMLQILIKLSSYMMAVPIGGMALQAIIVALNEWSRKSELSADRAGALVVQDPQICYELHMKMAGGGNVGDMDINEFYKQAKEYEEGGTVVDSLYKILNLIGSTHPFNVLRLTELKVWVEGGSYDEILKGNYETRGADSNKGILDDIKEAKDQYVSDIENSKDPLAKSVSSLINNVDDLVGNVFKSFSDAFNKDEDKNKDKDKDDSEK
ncbi:MAG: hypothetical protein COA79_11000 [Planctomycetota bacterium]|nr:MAG: hypothetical protein COA79_11000 [Planctomycetota bacterium]